MRYLRYLWFMYVDHGTSNYSENVLSDGLTQYQRDLCKYYHKPKVRK